MTQPHGRSLTPEELAILAIVQDVYGPSNTPDAVVFSDSAEALIVAKGPDGAEVAMVVLTNYADWHRQGLMTLEEVRRDITVPGWDAV